MSVVAVYNMKGGVGKTTTAVNLSYLAAAAGQRTLLWDLDPQAASSFAFRVRPHVAGFGKKSLGSAEVLTGAIKQTDYDKLDLLPADFAYRKLDRLLGHFGNPTRVVATLLGTIGRDYDTVFLDCPAGFSLLTEGLFAATDAVLMPTIPTVLSLRMVARTLKWAGRSDSPAELAAFFSMVDRRKTLHRRACDFPADLSEVFLTGQVPYASAVEQMTVRRMPLPVFAPRDTATAAFAGIWAELHARLQQRRERGPGRSRPRDSWGQSLLAIESLIAGLESTSGPEAETSRQTPALDVASGPVAFERRDVEHSRSRTVESKLGASSAVERGVPGKSDVCFVHHFDTAGRDLQRFGYVLELREREGNLCVAVARSDREDREQDGVDTAKWAQARIDSCWATSILSGVMSPLVALERRLGTSRPEVVEKVMAIVDGSKLRRIGSRVAGPVESQERANVNPDDCFVDRVAAEPTFPLHARLSQHG